MKNRTIDLAIVIVFVIILLSIFGCSKEELNETDLNVNIERLEIKHDTLPEVICIEIKSTIPGFVIDTTKVDTTRVGN